MQSCADRSPAVGLLWLWQWWQGTYMLQAHLPHSRELQWGPDSLHPAGSQHHPSLPEGVWLRVLGSVDQGKVAEVGWMAAAWGLSQVKGAGSWILRVHLLCLLSPALVHLHSPITLPLCAARWELGAISRTVLPAMCPCLIRGHWRPKTGFLLVLGLRFLNHLALSFVFCDGNNSMSSLGQDRGFPSRVCCSFESEGV